MKNKIEFNWEKYQSGLYDVITRDGRKVEKLRIIHSDSPYKIYCVISNDIERFTINGYFLDDGSKNNFDLFLITKEKEERIAEVGETIIPELKGVLMEVSDEEDFENTSQEFIIGTLNGLFISNTLESWSYARPIKEVKECWVNVYEINDMVDLGASYKTKDRAEKMIQKERKYIKTIKITNEKDDKIL